MNMSMNYGLGDLSTEMSGVSGIISMLGDCVTPAALPGAETCLSEATLEKLIFSITQQLDRIAEDLNEWESKLLELEHEHETHAAE